MVRNLFLRYDIIKPNYTYITDQDPKYKTVLSKS